MTAGVLGILDIGTVRAQTPAAVGDLQSRYDAAFQEMLREPSKLDVLFKFATLAAETGDLEGSISALERMLLIDPDLPRVRLELGVLYYRLGSYEVARTYLETVLKSASPPPDVRSRAEEFMAEVQKQQNPWRFSGEAFLGWRYQSNANLGPPTTTIQLSGQLASLNQAGIGTPDWGVVSSVAVRHVYDFGRQDKAALETQFIGYANRQFQVSTANISLLDLTTGPRFQVFEGLFEDVTLKPFIAGGYIWVNDTPYYGSYGGGVESGVLVSDRLRNTSVFSWRKHDHQDTWYLPTNGDYRGVEWTGATTFQYQLTPTVALYGTGTGQRYQTEQSPSLNYVMWALGGGAAYRFADPLFKTTLLWTVSLSVTEQWWNYDAPDANVDPNILRYQNDTILNLILSVPFDERTTFSVTGGRYVRTATLPNYAFENNSLMFGVSWRF